MNGKPITYATSPEIGIYQKNVDFIKMKWKRTHFLAQLHEKTDAKLALNKWLERMEIPHYANQSRGVIKGSTKSSYAS